MISQSNEACDWCRRPFDAFFDARAGIKKAPQAKKGVPTAVKAVASSVAIIVALYSLAQMKTAPDGAQISEMAPAMKTSKAAGLKQAADPTAELKAPEAQITAPLAAQNPNASIPAPNSNEPGPAAENTPAVEKPVAKLAAVHISTQKDASGNEAAVGTVVIVNQSAYEISDFSLSLDVGGVPTPLTPFEGTVNYPMAMTRTRVPPHGDLQISVMSAHPYVSPDGSSRSVNLEAHFEGAGQSATDSARLSPSG